MKRFGNLYDRIISIENLDLAERKARKDKGKRKDVAEFDKDRDGNLRRLHDDLKNGTFHTSPYTIFKVYEPKERDIYRLPFYPDRLVHHAIMNILEPVWTKVFTYNTYSCIKERGITGCAEQVERIIRFYDESPCLYCLKIDIRKYYPSIDHGVMKSIIRRKIKYKRLLDLLDGIIDSTNGLAIGNYLSQFLANLYLAYFMHYVNETLKVKAVEYADDIVFFVPTKDILHDTLVKVKKYAETRLKVEIKDNLQPLH